MRDANTIVRERQREIRCQMDDLRLSLKGVAFRAGMSVSTLTSYFTGERDKEPATLNVAGLFKLVEGEALPLGLLSMLLPDGYQIVRAAEGNDHDALCELAAGYVSEKIAAHHPDSEAGVFVGPGEERKLDDMIVQIVSLAA